MVLLAACGGGKVDDVEPLEPQPYGESEETNIQLWLETMELSSRELFAARENVVAALRLQPGQRVADIGAGTGLYTLMFAPIVGDEGVVYAVDIEPRFLRLINQRVDDLDMTNVVSVLSHPKDITLPSGSVDAVYIADTYHYLDDPEAVMATVRDALVDGGRLFMVEFNRGAPGVDSQNKDHVRFGKAELVAELETMGFALVEEPKVDGLKDYYMAVFEKVSLAEVSAEQSTD